MENFQGAMLSSWNSVSGPKFEHAWLLNDHSLFYLPMNYCVKVKNFETIKGRYSFIPFKRKESVISDDTKQSLNFCSLMENVAWTIENLRKYLRMSGKLLLTEMETKRPFTENCSRLYQLENKIIFSVVFCKQILALRESKNLENTCLCLSTVFISSNMMFIVKLQNIIDLHMRHVVSVIQKSSIKESLSSQNVLKNFVHLCEAIQMIETETNKLNEVQYFPRFSQFQLRLKFLSRAIVSHMQTSGCSIVIGSSQFTVNQVAVILLLFNTEKEKYCSVPVIKSSQGMCYRGLPVQGLIRDYNQCSRLELPEEYYNNCPVTVIDTDSYKVCQSLPNCLHQNSSKSLKTVTDSGKLIPGFLQDMFSLEECRLPTKDVLSCLRKCIHIKAVTLIKLIERFRNDNSTPAEKQLMTLMDAGDSSDFKIYVGFAEKLKPGIRASIM